MSLRLILILSILLFGAAVSWRNPFRATLLYLWFAYFRPDDWVGWLPIVREMRLSLFIGVFALFGALVTARKIRAGLGSALLLIFFVVTLLSTQFSVNEFYSMVSWRKFAPALLIGWVLILLVDREVRLRQVLVVVGLSLGFELSKQGWVNLILQTGHKMWPTHPALGDNNGVAVGMYMLIPLLIALAATATRRIEKLLFIGVTIGALYTGFATYSRGGFLSAIALGLHYLLRSRHKVASLVTVVVVALAIGPLFPKWFWDRMWTIETAAEAVNSGDQLSQEELDSSMTSRLHFWNVAIVMAEDRPVTGVGFNAYNQAYNRYDFLQGRYGKNRSVHSMWFGVLAELGFPGFFLFVAMLLLSIWNCWRIRAISKQYADLKSIGVYASAVEAGILVAMVGGSFVPFQYTEMLWHLCALSFAMRYLVADYATAKKPLRASAAPAFSNLRPVPVTLSPTSPAPARSWASAR